MQHDRRRRQFPRVLTACLALAVGLAGCNILAWTHAEGGSSDPETLLRDAEDALLGRDYAKALKFARKGIDNDPPPMQYPRLRYVATQAVLAQGGIRIASYLNVFTNQAGSPKPWTGAPRAAGTYPLLNLTIAELRAIATSCPQAVDFLRQILDALGAGDITPADLLGIQFDVDVGFGIANLLVALVTVLDADQDLSNGFVQDPDVTILADETGGYFFQYTGPGDANAYIRGRLFCPRGADFADALQGVWDAYRGAKGLSTPADLPFTGAGPGALPGPVDTSFLIGEVLSFVHAGLARLYADWGPCTGPVAAAGWR